MRPRRYVSKVTQGMRLEGQLHQKNSGALWAGETGSDVYFDEVTRSGFHVEHRWGQGEAMQTSVDPPIGLYVRRGLGLSVTTVGVFEGGINRRTGRWVDRVGQVVSEREKERMTQVAGWSNWEDGNILLQDREDGGKAGLGKEVFTPYVYASVS